MNYDDKFERIVNHALQSDKKFTRAINRTQAKAHRGRCTGIILTVTGLLMITIMTLYGYGDNIATLWLTAAGVLIFVGCVSMWSNGFAGLNKKTQQMFDSYCKNLEPQIEKNNPDDQC